MPRSSSRGRKVVAPVDESNTSSSSSESDEYGGSKTMKKRSSTARSTRVSRSTYAGKRSTSTGRGGGRRRGSNIKRNSRGRVSKGRRKSTSRNEDPSSSSSESLDDYYYQQSASSSRGRRRRRQVSSSSSRGGKSRNSKKTSGKRSGQKQKRSKLTGKARRQRRSTPFPKTKARRRQKKQKQSTASLSSDHRLVNENIHERFQKSLSSLQASLKTDASMIDSIDDNNSDVILSLPITQQPPKSVNKVDRTLLKNVHDVNGQSSSPTEAKLNVEEKLEIFSLNVEKTEKQLDEQIKSEQSSLNLDTSSYNTSPTTVELPSPVSSPTVASFQVTVNSSSLKEWLEANSVPATPQQQSATPVAASLESNGNKQPSLSSMEELQQMLNDCLDCISSSSELSEEETNSSSSKVVEEFAPPLQQEDKIDMVGNLVEDHSASGISSLSLSIRSD